MTTPRTFSTHFGDETSGVVKQLLQDLNRLYHVMDQQYQKVARAYGFSCSGCGDSCCFTLFYHHTHCEWFYLREGFLGLEPPVRREMVERARDYGMRTPAPAEGMNRMPVICPANENGGCRLYAHRPMICRLHGIPHELHTPGRPEIQGPGCHVFESECAGNADMRLDRTALYREMAFLEKRFQAVAGPSSRCKMTVAEMILSFSGEDQHPVDGCGE